MSAICSVCEVASHFSTSGFFGPSCIIAKSQTMRKVHDDICSLGDLLVCYDDQLCGLNNVLPHGLDCHQRCQAHEILPRQCLPLGYARHFPKLAQQFVLTAEVAVDLSAADVG
jgi:hypothetical protein